VAQVSAPVTTCSSVSWRVRPATIERRPVATELAVGDRKDLGGLGRDAPAHSQTSPVCESRRDISPTLRRFCEERLQRGGDDLVCELRSAGRALASLQWACDCRHRAWPAALPCLRGGADRGEPWLDELGQPDFRLILATGVVAFLIGVTLAAAFWEKWVVN
jgi:hypothetical protein